MKKKILVLTVISVCVLICASFPAYALERSLSPALDGIASECGMVKSGVRGGDIDFEISDFRQALGTSKFGSIVVTSLPSASDGMLKLSGVRVVAGQEIDTEYLGLLSFSPASELVCESKFGFRCEDLSATEITCQLIVTDGVNRAPSVNSSVATSVSAWTQKGIALEGRVRGSDPEGDALTYQVVKYPRKGSLIMESDGSYVYTPRKNYTGDDEFTYVARDEYGNYSTVATVDVSVVKRVSGVEYDDVNGGKLTNAVSVMTASGIMNGRISGDQLLFEPELEVTRSEFTVMAMKAVGIRPSSDRAVTFFDDDADIPNAERPYIALAQKLGYVNGNFDGNGLYFRPNDKITAAEAAVIVRKLLGTASSDASEVFASDEQVVPTWASIPASSLYEAGVVDDDWLTLDITSRTLTRADVAELLFGAVRYIKTK